MKKFKLFLPVLLTFVALSTIPTTTNTISPCSLEDENEISPFVEQVEWVYRTYNGVLQKRLWSNSSNCWLTDWIDCE